MSFEEGKAYNETLMPIVGGNVDPDSKIPAQIIMHDLWSVMRACDSELAEDIVEPLFLFMRAQTDPKRKKIEGLRDYLRYREGDVGRA